jgi:5'-3' exonuclease
MQHINKSEKTYDKYRIINDFIFLCYFCGNDFLPNIPSLNIKPPNKKVPNGIETIFESYATSMMEINNINNGELQYLITNTNKIKINQILFLNILKILSDDETTYYTDLYNHRRYIKRSTSTDLFDIDKHNFEENIISDFKDQIQLGNPKLKLIDWKYNYYKHYFHIHIDKTKLSDNSLNSVIDDYIRGLVWTNYYYFDKCKDYEWYFEHHHGLFISDIYSYLQRFPNKLTTYEELYSHGVWYQGKIKPLHQLMLVLPHESSYLIPSSYRTLMFGYKLKKYFPNNIMDIKMDYLYKNKGWQNIPMINIIPPNKILQLTSKIILREENERNKLYMDYVKLSI